MSLIKELYRSKSLVLNLAKNDFKTKYSGSALGIFWSIAPSIMTVAVYWFIFNIGFRVMPIEGVPYLLWLVSGLVPWFFFADALTSSTHSFIEYSYLIKKVVFKVSNIPLIKIISALFTHIFFMWILLYIFILHGYIPSVYNLQIIYYTLCLIVLITSISLITSTLNVFFRDIGQLISVCLQFGIWLAPIMWDLNMFPEKYRVLFKLNPLQYIIQGYRESLIYNIPIYSHFKQGIYFWTFCIIMLGIGMYLYKKLKPHFADLL